MRVILPCLFLAALGLLFGALHMAAYKRASEDRDDAGQATPICDGKSCGGCGFIGCSGYAAASGKTEKQ